MVTMTQQAESALDHADICACVVAQADFCENWPALMLISPLFAAAVRATAEYKFLREYNSTFAPRAIVNGLTAAHLLLAAASAQPRVYKIEQWCINILPVDVVFQIGLYTERKDLAAHRIDSLLTRAGAICVLNDIIRASHDHPQIVTWRFNKLSLYLYRYRAYMYWFIGQPLINHAGVCSQKPCKCCQYREQLIHACWTDHDAFCTNFDAVKLMRDSQLLEECAPPL